MSHRAIKLRPLGYNLLYEAKIINVFVGKTHLCCYQIRITGIAVRLLQLSIHTSLVNKKSCKGTGHTPRESGNP